MSKIEYFAQHQNLFKTIVSDTGTPVFITDSSILSKQVRQLQANFTKKVEIFYALKANYNPAIVHSLKKAGVSGIETISPYEIYLAKKYGFNSKQILFTGNNLDPADLEFGFQEKVIINSPYAKIEKMKGKIYSLKD